MKRQLSVLIAALFAMWTGLGCVQAPDVSSDGVLGTADPTGEPFVMFPIIERTFTAGKAVQTYRYDPQDLMRTPIPIDFDGDGRADPVVGYGSDNTKVVPNQAVAQILLSQGPAGTVAPLSLTLDEPAEEGGTVPGMSGLEDLAVGDIDKDGELDIVVAAINPSARIYYLHHPTVRDTTDLRYWDINPIDASGDLSAVDVNQVNNMIGSLIPPNCSLLEFDLKIRQGFANVELADMDFDGNLDVVASQFIEIVLDPEPDACVDEPIVFTSGQIAILWNPGGDASGVGWTSSELGIHERFAAEPDTDRAGASGLFLVDLDKDGDFDIISSARLDNNVQVAWFANPKVPDALAARDCVQTGDVRDRDEWCQWRIGSLRDAFSVDVGDVTGDGLVDVVATGKAQKQVVLFSQPSIGPKREYDWDSFVVGQFNNYEPIDIHIVDIDSDGVNELVIGATQGTIRRFDRPANPQDPWTAGNIFTFTFDTDAAQASQTDEGDLGTGDIGLLGVVDLDGDGDPDIVAVVNADDPSGNKDLIAWIRNDLTGGGAGTGSTPATQPGGG